MFDASGRLLAQAVAISEEGSILTLAWRDGVWRVALLTPVTAPGARLRPDPWRGE